MIQQVLVHFHSRIQKFLIKLTFSIFRMYWCNSRLLYIGRVVGYFVGGPEFPWVVMVVAYLSILMVAIT